MVPPQQPRGRHGPDRLLAFFTYFYASMTFATAQNRLFPVYVAAAALSGFALVLVASRLDPSIVAQALPARP